MANNMVFNTAEECTRAMMKIRLRRAELEAADKEHEAQVMKELLYLKYGKAYRVLKVFMEWLDISDEDFLLLSEEELMNKFMNPKK